MGNTRSSQSTRIDWLAAGPLAPHLDAFKQYLTDRGHAATTFTNCVCSVAHFAQWLHGRRLRARRINEAVVAEFLDDHLPRSHCTRPAHSNAKAMSRSALTDLAKSRATIESAKLCRDDLHIVAICT